MVPSRVKKAYEREEKQKQKALENKVKPKKVQEQEKRDEGLQAAIGSSNKGFALLSKMGYKPGTAIGKRGLICLKFTLFDKQKIYLQTF